MVNAYRLLPRLALLVLSTLLGLFTAEWVYRLKLLRARGAIGYNYRVSPSVPVGHDEKYGDHPKPNVESWGCFIRDGKVAWGSVVARSNRDGLMGKTTFDQYEKADIRILAFGDSFTEWNQGDTTWPDLLQEELHNRLNRKVAVLDYARAGYGALQMLDLAADEIAELHPDLTIVALIGDDFSRARWWSQEIEKDGLTRFMLSTRKDNFTDYHFATDQVLIVPEATRAWCERQLVHPDPQDPVLERANRQFATVKHEVESVRKAVPLLSWDYSFVYQRLTTGSAYKYPDSNMPRVSIVDLCRDRRAAEDARRIQKAGSRVMLVYLPTMEEFKKRKVMASRKDVLLMNSMEAMLNTRFRLLQEEYYGALPVKIDMLPYDWHPNLDGLKLYAVILAPMTLQKLRSLSTIKAPSSGTSG